MLLEFVNREDVGGENFRLEADENIISEYEFRFSDRDHVARNAFVFRRNAVRREQSGLNRTENLLARGIERGARVAQ